MPAPLGKTVTRKMPKIDVFGLESSAATRAAIRFFRERRVVVTFVDLGKRPMDAAELRQFIDQIGVAGVLLDPWPEAASNRGLLLARVREDPGLLRLPLVRHGKELTAGQEEAAWKVWLGRR